MIEKKTDIDPTTTDPRKIAILASVEADAGRHEDAERLYLKAASRACSDALTAWGSKNADDLRAFARLCDTDAGRQRRLAALALYRDADPGTMKVPT